MRMLALAFVPVLLVTSGCQLIANFDENRLDSGRADTGPRDAGPRDVVDAVDAGNDVIEAQSPDVIDAGASDTAADAVDAVDAVDVTADAPIDADP